MDKEIRILTGVIVLPDKSGWVLEKEITPVDYSTKPPDKEIIVMDKPGKAVDKEITPVEGSIMPPDKEIILPDKTATRPKACKY